MPAHGLPVILSHDTSEDAKCYKKVFNLFTPYFFRLDFIINTMIGHRTVIVHWKGTGRYGFQNIGFF